jgi:hypothetical protein
MVLLPNTLVSPGVVALVSVAVVGSGGGEAETTLPRAIIVSSATTADSASLSGFTYPVVDIGQTVPYDAWAGS